MKNYLPLILLVLPFFFSQCHKPQKVEKDVTNYYPKVKTVSAVMQPDGSVKVTGEVISSGSTAISYAGFCMDTIPNPHMLSNQVLVYELSNNQFSYTYHSTFMPFKKYYFRAWVGNGNGYAIGSDVAIDNVIFDTSQIPCHPQVQKMQLTGITTTANLNENYTHIQPLDKSGSNYTFNAYTGSHSIEIAFAKFPTSGIYTVTDASYAQDTFVTVRVDAIRSQGAAKLYVAQINSNTVEITICSLIVFANYGLSTYKFNMATRFQALTN